MGLNISQYHGQNITIRVTSFNCGQSGPNHCGYVYYTLGCSKARIVANTCGNNAQVATLTAPSGFLYRWYNRSLPNWSSNQQTVQVNIDSSVYRRKRQEEVRRYGGPAHILWNVVLVGYTLANIVAIAYAARTRINVSYKNLIAIACMTFISIISFLISRRVGSDTMVVPTVYVIDEFILFFVCLRVRMSDISDSVLESLEAENQNAYVAFSDKGIYFGCNDIAYKFFPELKEFRVDAPMPENLGISRSFRDLMDTFVKRESLNDYYFAYGQRNYKVNVRKIYRNKISHVVLFRIEDETKLQRYIQKLDTHNTKLKDVIKDNDRHIHAIQER